MRVSSLWEGTRALDAPVRDLPFREEPHEEPLDDATPEVRRLARTVRAFLAHHVQPAGADHRLAADAGGEAQAGSLPRTMLTRLPGPSIGRIPTETAPCGLLPVDKRGSLRAGSKMQ